MTELTASVHAKATFQTPQATRHLVALCTHFSRRITATCTDTAGHVAFPFGTCDLMADATQLTFVAAAPDAGKLFQITDVVTRHLERFAFRENPTLDWTPFDPSHALTPFKEIHT
ncbi:MAG: DUF2218 domain-containing protein [Pseudomonadota bacterium]